MNAMSMPSWFWGEAMYFISFSRRECHN
jgi:hypothetical protein